MKYACPKEQKLADAISTAIAQAISMDDLDPDRVNEIAADWFGTPRIKPAGLDEDGPFPPIDLNVRGRGDLHGTAVLSTDGALLRLDDRRSDEFWAEIVLPVRDLASLLASRAECEIPLAVPVEGFNDALAWFATNALGFTRKQMDRLGDSDHCLAGAMLARLEDERQSGLGQHVGRFARSTLTGWVGKIVAIKRQGGEFLYQMHGVDRLALAMGGGEDSVSPDDVRWVSYEDVELLQT